MIIIAGHVRIQPEYRDAVIAAMKDMMAETAKEDGCVSYDFSSDLNDDTIFHLFEEWESPEHLEAHFVAPHMVTYQQKLADFGEIDRHLHRYTAGDKAPL